ncbi:MAG TPA: PLP-dependent aminotransferase family protein [Ideonella sp.]|nr:PLP-dependent aminotransferase family protein [Ideonella sp.]
MLYRQIADHYLGAIHAGTLRVGERMPSVRTLMRTHGVSLSTALQACRHLEDQGWLQARPRSGYFVQRPRRSQLAPAAEQLQPVPPDPAAYVGIHAKVSAILALGQQQPVRVNLAQAMGTPELYPTQALQRIAQQVLRQHPAVLTTMTRRYGHPALRAVLARRLLERGVQAAPDDVVVTCGCTEALNLALRAVTQPGDTVAVESPTFYGMLQVLEALGLRALEIPTSPHTGLSLEAFEFALREHAGIRALLAMPNLQNPLGSVMPDAHKERLVRLCEAHGVALVEDDIYSETALAEAPLKPAKAFDRSGQVIWCGSLNKQLAPGLRLGWMLAGKWQARVEMLKYSQSRYTDELPQMVAAEFLAGSAYDRHLQRLRSALQRQREQCAEAVAAYFPAGTRLSVPPGGFVLWVELPGAVSSEAVFEAALARGIRISPGSMFTNSRRFDHFVRLGCGLPFTAQAEEAVRELGQIVGAMAGA